MFIGTEFLCTHFFDGHSEALHERYQEFILKTRNARSGGLFITQDCNHLTVKLLPDAAKFWDM